jgi:hypothetical protein
MFRFAPLALSLGLATLAARAAEPGFVDLGTLKGADDAQFVEVNLGAPLLKFASVVVAKHDADAAALLRSLKRVHVNVVALNDTNRADATQRVQAFRRQLETEGWQRVVTVRESVKADDVVIFAKMGADDSVEGLVVTVLESGQSQAVVVNVVGNIKPEQLAALSRHLEIEGLEHVKLPEPAKRS